MINVGTDGKYLKLKEQAVDCSVKRIRAALMLLAYNINDLLDEQFWSCGYARPQELEACVEFILDSVKNMEGASAGNRERIGGEIEGKRGVVLELYKCLHCYGDALAILAGEINDRVIAGNLHAGQSMDSRRILSDCARFITEGMSGEKPADYTSDVIQCFPVKITRDKMYDYIRACLTEALSQGRTKEYAEGYAQTLLYMCDPASSPVYGKYFGDVLEAINEYAVIDLSKLDADEATELYDEICGFREHITALTDDLNIVFETLNYLQIAYLFVDDLDKLSEDGGIVLKDLVYTTIAALRQGEYEIYKDSLEKMLDDNCERFVDEAETSFGKLAPLIKHADFEQAGGDVAIAVKAVNAVNEIFYGDIFLHSFPIFGEFMTGGSEREVVIAADELNAVIDAFIGTVGKLLREMPIRRQKTFKRSLMSVAGCPSAPDEFMDYIENSFGSISDASEQGLVVDKLTRLFEVHGFEPDKDGAHHGAEHDCTGHACGCHEH